MSNYKKIVGLRFSEQDVSLWEEISKLSEDQETSMNQVSLALLQYALEELKQSGKKITIGIRYKVE